MNVQVSTVVMMLVLGSLALIGVGVSILIKENERNALVGEYKEGVEAFAANKGRFRRTRLYAELGAGNRVELERFEGEETINGYTGDLPTEKAESFGWTALVDATDAWTIAQTIDDAAMGSIALHRLSVAVPSSEQLVCRPDNFDRTTGTCPDAFLDEMCHSLSGDPTIGTVTKDPAVTGECPRDNVICGTCDFNFYLNTRVEFVVWLGTPQAWGTPSALGWPQFPQGRFFPFNLSQQEFSYEFKNPMNLTLKPVGDPYALAQNITEGTMDFGQTLDDQRQNGLIMIATGSITFLICTGAMAGMRYMSVKANKEKEAAAKEAAKNLNANGANPNDADGAATAGAAGGGAAVAQGANPQQQQQQQQQQHNDGSGEWNGTGNHSNPQGGANNNDGGGGGQNPMNQFARDGGGNGDGRGGNGWGGNRNDEDFRAVGPGSNRYNRSGKGDRDRGGGDRRQPAGYGARGHQRRNSNNSGNGGGSSGHGGSGRHNSSGNGSRSRGGGFNSGGDSANRGSGSGSAQIAQALRRGPTSGGGRSGGGGGRRHRSNSRSRRIEDDPDL